ncbi:MAG: phenylalanine--tRNA ligase subunit beta, partial [Cyanobacteria bacterium P01_H01_bin.121]
YRYRDLEREVDLLEEIARLYGYDNFCTTLPAKTEWGYLSREQKVTRQLREACRAAGLTELMHYSLVKPEGDRQIQLSNPLLAEYSALRTELLDGLLDAFQYNLEQGNGPLNGFEVGRIFWSESEGLAEADLLAGVLGGDPTQGTWIRSGQPQPLSWYEAKGVLEQIFQRLNLTLEYRPHQAGDRLHPGRTAALWLQGKNLGFFGQIHPQVSKQRGLPSEVYVFEINLDQLVTVLTRRSEVAKFSAFSTYPAADRDLAFFVSTEVTVAALEKAMLKAGKPLLAAVSLFDQYRGANVPDGQRSLAFRLLYRSGDRTLTDADVDPLHQKVRDAIVKQFKVDLRS